MWYAKNEARKSETPAEKKLREARQTLKWIPYVSAVVLIVTVCECVALAEHPNMERLLNLVSPVGMTLYLLSHWKKADVVLKGTSETWHMGAFLLGVVLMVGGPTLKDIWHHGDMSTFRAVVGMGLTFALFCLWLIIVDVISRRRSTPRK